MSLMVVSVVDVRGAMAQAKQDVGGGDIADVAIGLEWERASGAGSCADGDSLRRAAERLLERRAFVTREQANVFIRGRVALAADGQSYRAHLVLVAGDGRSVGQRDLSSETPDCASLDDPLALVIALAVDTLRAMPRSVLRIPPPRSSSGWRAEAAPIAVAAWGLLPTVGAGLGFNLRVQPPSFWPIEAGLVSWFMPSRQTTPAGQGGEFRAIGMRLSLCPPLVRGSTSELRLCVGADAADITAMGLALDVSRSPSRWVWGGGARLSFLWLFGRSFGIEPSVGLVLPVVRDRFVYTDEGGQLQVVHQPSRAIVWLELGLPIKIP
jgi:hypothetical protein